jgi:hypothetical protein
MISVVFLVAARLRRASVAKLEFFLADFIKPAILLTSSGVKIRPSKTQSCRDSSLS